MSRISQQSIFNIVAADKSTKRTKLRNINMLHANLKTLRHALC